MLEPPGEESAGVVPEVAPGVSVPAARSAPAGPDGWGGEGFADRPGDSSIDALDESVAGGPTGSAPAFPGCSTTDIAGGGVSDLGTLAAAPEASKAMTIVPPAAALLNNSFIKNNNSNRPSEQG